ncbi:response regulator [Dolichospermum sp. ST_sed1]|nr:response regulator [Dolichospermum sp. ST_sed1]MDD1426504.1 response regulator [Dolichospermum sp. ST_sed9]MDD1432694.1 response regulator [Dolichospermum sp. ST_sed6]MDD1438434.1 response regulator [Dolichospermum sp. ST_sed10]MDD1442008.1 response regulator [Dolichospermum sp. ST_sed3]MDD1447789.1 response regulator [Dolichospermum sp. ST_sed8]MDD1458046.1 response regulator [Dolichospermum sp. ST_sed7]MDD1462222.1 response regulator [Dolichospermum sp. ST_sed2]MDD1465584.1 response re
MINPEVTEAQKLFNQFKECIQLQYNGQLNIKSSKGRKWIFYYRLGRIVWATGSDHPFRRWRRNMAKYCPDIDISKIRCRGEDIAIDFWDYQLLDVLYKRQKIQREKIHAIVESTIAELFFDLAQELDFASVNCSYSQEVILEMPMSFTNADMSIKQMQDAWSIWSQAGLTNISPNLAPVLRRPEQLQQMVNPSVYKNFVSLINGQFTLRELGMKMKQDVMPVTRSLLPYILKGIIELVPVPDSPLIVESSSSTAKQPRKQTSPLIACVDDSPQVCKILEEIMTRNGLRFIQIQDAVQALPIIIQEKPDLIFLDLIMPIASGYEICTQLRRISAFAQTPVIILTGNDGLVDRVRAKVVGSTDFMSKPIVADRVMNMVRKYLRIPNLSNNNNGGNLQAPSENNF